MIEAEKLVKYYGDRQVVQEISFEVQKGEIVGLLGPNGAGKTTTMRMLTGYIPIDGGRATVAGFDVGDKPMEVRKRLGYLPETVPLYTEMVVRDYLNFIAKIRGVPGKGRNKRVDEVMELARISDVQSRVIGKLSRGYKQRVGLAQAIIHNPQVIILDEPTVGLDPRQIIEIRKVIRDLAGNHSMILSTHILSEVSALCDRVVIVNRGKVLVQDTLDNLEKRASQGERLRVTVRGAQEKIEGLLGELGGVISYSKYEAPLSLAAQAAENQKAESDLTPAPAMDDPTATHSYNLEVEPGNDLRAALATAIVSREWGLLELRTVSPTLEEIFVQLITDDLAQAEAEEAELTAYKPVADDDELDEYEDDDQADSGEPVSAVDDDELEEVAVPKVSKVVAVKNPVRPVTDDDELEEMAAAPTLEMPVQQEEPVAPVAVETVEAPSAAEPVVAKKPASARKNSKAAKSRPAPAFLNEEE